MFSIYVSITFLVRFTDTRAIIGIYLFAPSVVGRRAKGNFPAEGGEIPFGRMNTACFYFAVFPDIIYELYYNNIFVLKNHSAYVGVRVGTLNSKED